MLPLKLSERHVACLIYRSKYAHTDTHTHTQRETDTACQPDTHARTHTHRGKGGGAVKNDSFLPLIFYLKKRRKKAVAENLGILRFAQQNKSVSGSHSCMGSSVSRHSLIPSDLFTLGLAYMPVFETGTFQCRLVHADNVPHLGLSLSLCRTASSADTI